MPAVIAVKLQFGRGVVPYFGLAVFCVFASLRENVLFSTLVFTPSRRVRKEKPQSRHYRSCETRILDLSPLMLMRS
jgi:hypothetical protein